jgi:membrane fusion protein
MVLSIAAIALVVAVAVRVPETVTATFTLVPLRGADPIRALRRGVVREARVVTGQPVGAGALLFAIAAPDAADRAGELRGVERELSDAEARVANLRRAFDEQRAADLQERGRLLSRADALAARLAIQKRELAIASEILRRYEDSHKQGLTAWIESGRAEADVTRLQAEAAATEGEQADVRGSLARLDREMASRAAQWDEQVRAVREERDKTGIRRGVLSGDPSASGELRVVAPCDGTIVRAFVVQPGTVVDEGERLAEVACAGERLHAQLAVPQRGLGQLRVGQPVKLLYDAYPYERFGVAPAVVTWVSPAASTEGSEPFRAFADLGAGGPHSRAIGAGLSGQAEIVVGRRRLIAYLIDPLRRLQEDLK